MRMPSLSKPTPLTLLRTTSRLPLSPLAGNRTPCCTWRTIFAAAPAHKSQVLEQLRSATHFAPLHMPVALSLIHAAQKRFSGVPEFACSTPRSIAHSPKLPLIFLCPKILECRCSPLWIPRTLVRIRTVHARSGRAPPNDRRASREWGESHSDRERPLRRHHDGTYSDRWCGDGHALWRSRSRCIASHHSHEREQRRRAGKAPRQGSRSSRNLRNIE